jgi:hypothetical protein
VPARGRSEPDAAKSNLLLLRALHSNCRALRGLLPCRCPVVSFACWASKPPLSAKRLTSGHDKGGQGSLSAAVWSGVLQVQRSGHQLPYVLESNDHAHAARRWT